MKEELAIVILAAGKGERMYSELSKPLHLLAGKTMLARVVEAVSRLEPERVVLVVKDEKNFEAFKNDKVSFVKQERQLGTGDALKCAEGVLKNFPGTILTLCSDTPLIQTATLKDLILKHKRFGNAATLLASRADNPTGYGRVILKESECVESIVEENELKEGERDNNLVNAGIYCFNSDIFSVLKEIKADNKKGEYYLTDVVDILNKRALKVGYELAPFEEIIGVNKQSELQETEKIFKAKVK